MKKIIINGKEVQPKFTYNSFRHMEDLDLKELATLEDKPFKIISMFEKLLMGAVNCDPAVEFSDLDVRIYIEKNIKPAELIGMFSETIKLLEASDFFVGLQPKK